MERYLRVNLLGPGPRLMGKRIYRAAVSQRFRSTDLQHGTAAARAMLDVLFRDVTAYGKSTYTAFCPLSPVFHFSLCGNIQYLRFPDF